MSDADKVVPSWKVFHSLEEDKDYFKELNKKIDYLYSKDIQFFKPMYPPKDLIYRCFEETPLNEVKVVILGQDPYHQKKQANGLAFAVNPKMQIIPPSLRNIMKVSGTEDKTLLKWAKQGVLLLNNILTVKDSEPLSCGCIGWETYTNNAIRYLIENTDPDSVLIFCLWGENAKSKKDLIEEYDSDSITILEASHPSPLSANKTDNPFMECDHFNKINEILVSNKLNKIEW